jgi:NADPH-dependent curcumin reductase CurA
LQKRSYTAPIKQGEVIRSLGIGEILVSNSSKWKEGQVVHGYNFGWFDVGVINESQIVSETMYALILHLLMRKRTKLTPEISKIEGQSPYLSIGTIGLTGLTAYVGAYEICKLQQDHTIVISGAAG